MRAQVVGGACADDAKPGQPRDEEIGQAGNEQLTCESAGNQRRHAEIRLRRQHAQHRHQQRRRDRVARQPVMPALLGQHPGGHDDEERLGKFRGLQRQSRQRQPTRGALGFVAEHERQDHQQQRCQEAERSQAADAARRQQRNEEDQ